MTYLGIECDSLKTRFTVPEERVAKYLPLLQALGGRRSVTYSELEQIVGKLVSLECAVPAGMWYTREQYSALREAGISPEAKKAVKNHTSILVSQQMREEWVMWIHFLTENRGAAWRTMEAVYIKAEISSDASGRSFAGVVNMPGIFEKVVAGEFYGPMLAQDIQVKEGEALRQTLQMMVRCLCR